MSTVPSAIPQFAGTGPYRITSPNVEVDASGGTTSVVNNQNFATNLPVGMGMLITDIEWIVAYQQLPTAPNGSQTNIWFTIGQITEALQRTTPTTADNLDIAVFFEQIGIIGEQATAASIAQTLYRSNMERQHLSPPWLTVAQNLNLVVQAAATEQNVQDGQEVAIQCRIYFQLLALTAAQNQYLAQRIQISSQQ